MTVSVSHARRVVLAALALALLCSAAWKVRPVAAHVAIYTSYDCCARFQHQNHDRDFYLWNQIGNGTWAANARDAQLQLHSIYNGSLRFPSAGSSGSADLVLVDAYYSEGFVGRAYNWGHHRGQGRMQMNTMYSLSGWQAQATACHEISHFTGLAHSSDASDCMRDSLSAMPSAQLGTAHRDQMRGEWNASGH
jgi:hypothetical protein